MQSDQPSILAEEAIPADLSSALVYLKIKDWNGLKKFIRKRGVDFCNTKCQALGNQTFLDYCFKIHAYKIIYLIAKKASKQRFEQSAYDFYLLLKLDGITRDQKAYFHSKLFYSRFDGQVNAITKRLLDFMFSGNPKLNDKIVGYVINNDLLEEFAVLALKLSGFELFRQIVLCKKFPRENYYSTLLIAAVNAQHLGALKFVVQRWKSQDPQSYKNRDVRSHDEKTPLMLACGEFRELEIVRYLIDAKVDDLSKKDAEGLDAFVYAAKGGNVDILKLLAQRKGIKYFSSNLQGETEGPLIVAAEEGHIAAIKSILRTNNLYLSKLKHEKNSNLQDVARMELIVRGISVAKSALVGKSEAVDILMQSIMRLMDNYCNSETFPTVINMLQTVLLRTIGSIKILHEKYKNANIDNKSTRSPYDAVVKTLSKSIAEIEQCLGGSSKRVPKDLGAVPYCKENYLFSAPKEELLSPIAVTVSRKKKQPVGGSKKTFDLTEAEGEKALGNLNQTATTLELAARWKCEGNIFELTGKLENIKKIRFAFGQLRIRTSLSKSKKTIRIEINEYHYQEITKSEFREKFIDACKSFDPEYQQKKSSPLTAAYDSEAVQRALEKKEKEAGDLLVELLQDKNKFIRFCRQRNKKESLSEAERQQAEQQYKNILAKADKLQSRFQDKIEEIRHSVCNSYNRLQQAKSTNSKADQNLSLSHRPKI